MRLSQPSNTTWNAFSINLPPSLINITTRKKTSMNARKGNHLAETFTLSFKYVAATADNFNAAASPMINAMMEKSAMMKPFL